MDARPCRSGWSLWLNQLAGFIRVFQEDVFMLKSVFELSWTGFHVLPRIYFYVSSLSCAYEMRGEGSEARSTKVLICNGLLSD